MYRLIFFIHHQSGSRGAELRKYIRKHLPHIGRKTCDRIDTLRMELKRPGLNRDLDVYVALADTGERLCRLNELANLVDGKRLVLILPDSSKHTRSRGGRLWPRFMTHVNADYDDLCAVLNKMTGGGLSDKSDTLKNRE